VLTLYLQLSSRYRLIISIYKVIYPYLIFIAVNISDINFWFIFFWHRSICIVLNPSSGKQERLLYTNFKNTDPREYDYVRCCRYFFMMLEYLMITSGTFDGVVLTMNSKGVSWRHITKTPMNTMKKLLGFVQVRRTKTV